MEQNKAIDLPPEAFQKEQLFKVNLGVPDNNQRGTSVVRLPEIVQTQTVEGYAESFAPLAKTSQDALMRALTDGDMSGLRALMKTALPPSVQSFANICFSEDTEVLTRAGWKLFKNVDIEFDEFASLNLSSRQFEWQKAHHLTYNDYDGEMYHLKSVTIDLIVTPNHRVIYSKYQNNGLQVSTAEDLYNLNPKLKERQQNGYKKLFIPLTSNWIGTKIEQFELTQTKPGKRNLVQEATRNSTLFRIFSCEFCGSLFSTTNTHKKYSPKFCSVECRHLSDRKPVTMTGDDYCAFMGMYLAEGCIAKNQDTGKPGYLHITQLEKSKGYIPYKDLLTKIFGKEPSYLGKDFVICNSLLAEYVKELGNYAEIKSIPEIIMNATPEQIKIFLEYFRLGDGHSKFRGVVPKEFTTYGTSSKQMADQLQELIQKTGQSASIEIQKERTSNWPREEIGEDGTTQIVNYQIHSQVHYKVIVRQRDSRSFILTKIANYKGKIGCVSVPNGTLYVRRNHKPVWSGNSYMPNATTSQFGILQWPGLPPSTMEKVAREHVGLQMILQLRCSEVAKYAELTSTPWRAGWRIVSKIPHTNNETQTKKDIREAKEFIKNGGIGDKFANPRERDQLLRYDFSKFLSAIARSTLTYDAIAIWTDMDSTGKIESFAPMPAQNIRLLDRPDKVKNVLTQGELNFTGGPLNTNGKPPALTDSNEPLPRDATHFAVAVDETGNVVEKFTRNDLIWFVRNPRLDVSASGYGFSEVEMGLSVINGFTNAVRFNSDIFDRNSVPKGILLLKGSFTQRQLDSLGRIWDNLQRGARSDWTLPAIQISEKGSIEVISLEPLRAQPAYYSHMINLFFGIMATLYCFPVHKLGYKISGTEKDARREVNKEMMEEDDEGLPVLLGKLETLFNIYLLSTRWPHLKFEFTGKSPKEDARLYEAEKLSMTWDELRDKVNMPKLIDTVTGAEAKEIAEIMGMCPIDPNLSGVFQTVIAAKYREAGQDAGKGELDKPGNTMTSKKDPAKSEGKGHISGVRRDSRAEKDAADTKKPPNLSLGSLRTQNNGKVDASE